MKPEFAVIATGGKQYVVKPEGLLKVEKLEGSVGDNVVFSEVLLVAEGENAVVGKPTVASATVMAEIIKQGRAKKVTGVKFKPKKRQKVAFGHRQPFTEVLIKEIKFEK